MESSPAETFSLTDEGLQMHLVPPPQYERLIHKATSKYTLFTRRKIKADLMSC